jgi:TrmH family RNA methyltransferase
VLSKTKFQALLQLTRKKERTASGKFFVEGWRWLEEALALADPPEIVLATPDVARTPAEKKLLARAKAAAREFAEVTPEQLARLTGNASAPGVAALVRWRPVGSDAALRAMPNDGPALALAFDAVGDPGNAGTLVRTADWFGAKAVFFGEGSVEPANPKLVRSTMGSLFHLPVAETESLVDMLGQLRSAGFSIVGAALDGEDLREFRWPARTVLVLGNEANGICPAVAATLDFRVRIPSFGRAESLNAAVAGAVLMADWRRVAGR